MGTFDNTEEIMKFDKGIKILEENIFALVGEIDFVSIDLTAALELLSELTGGNVTEDIADKIFSTFCVGK